MIAPRSHGSPPNFALASAIGLAVGALSLAGPTTTSAQVIRANFDRPYGPVHAMATSGDTLYVGGDFDHVGPSTSNAVTLSPTTGRLIDDLGLGMFGASCIPDGEGGWYVAGYYHFMPSNTDRRIAHILADGSLGDFDPDIDGPVYCLALRGTTLYAGGEFNAVQGRVQRKLAAFDVVADTLIDWKPGFASACCVLDLEIVDTLVYFVGRFDDVGGVSRLNAAAVDVTTAAVAPWNPRPNDFVGALDVQDSVVYLAGSFFEVGGATRSALAAVDPTHGLVLGWNPSASSLCTEIVANGTQVYVGGGFSSIGGMPRAAWAAIDASTGAILPWTAEIEHIPNRIAPSVAAFAVIDSILYLGGEFMSVGGERRQHLAAFDTRTGALMPWNPGATRRVDALAAQDTVLFASGWFDRAGGTPRNHLAAIDVVNGRTTDWNPDANGIVRALAAQGSTVYAGGSFGRIGGATHRALTAIDAVSGAPIAGWAGTATGAVRALALSGPVLYAGGSFTQVNGQPRSRLAALDATSGALTSWQPGADSTVRALAVAGPRVYVGGDFDHAGGANRIRVAALDSLTGNPFLWNVHAMSPGENVYALATHGARLYVGGDFSTLGGAPRANFAALDTATGDAVAWKHDFEKSIYAIAAGASGNPVFVAGSGDFSDGVFALDAVTGSAENWHPPTVGSLFSVLTDGQFVYAGGESGLDAIVAPGVTSTLLSFFHAQSLPEGVVLRWRLASEVAGARIGIERSQADGPWTAIPIPIQNEGEHFTATDRGVESDRTYRYRLILELASGRAVFGPVEVSTGPGTESFELTRVSPIPSLGPVTIEFSLPRAAPVRLHVVDVQGRVVARLIDGILRPGRYQATWTGDDDAGGSKAGVYFVRLEAAGRQATRRLVRYR